MSTVHEDQTEGLHWVKTHGNRRGGAGQQMMEGAQGDLMGVGYTGT